MSKCQKMKIDKCTNTVEPDEAAHNELPHLGLHCLLFSLYILSMDDFFFFCFLDFADVNN